MKPPSSEWLIAQAREIGAELREQQDDSDARGCYSEAIHRRLLEGGFYRILQPRLFGGFGTDCETYIRVIMELSRGHPGSAWCYTLASSHAVVLGSSFREDVQRELFGPEGDFRAAFAAAPAGLPTFERVDGGYNVTGLWPFASGIPVSNHFLAGAPIPGPDGKLTPIAFVVAREKVTVLPDWGGDEPMGMQASGSNSVRLAKVSFRIGTSRPTRSCASRPKDCRTVRLARACTRRVSSSASSTAGSAASSERS